MRMSRLRVRLLLATVMSIITGASAVVAVQTSALAASNTLYPSGCNQVMTDSWLPTCWAGYNYVQTAVSVMSVQYVLQDTGHSPGAIDCRFGSSTDNATIAYQRERGLQQDGIVGKTTWSSLQDRLSNSGITDTYGTYYNVGIDGLRFYWQIALGGSWFVRDPQYSNRYVASAGYVSRNVTPFC
jgi:hypothetical protein